MKKNIKQWKKHREKFQRGEPPAPLTPDERKKLMNIDKIVPYADVRYVPTSRCSRRGGVWRQGY